MFGQSSKRRRVEPPTKQSKLHHFFSKPVDRTENLLSQISSQKSRNTDRKNDKFKLLKDESHAILSTQPDAKAGSFDRGDPGNIFLSCKKEQAFEKRPILRDVGNSFSYVDNITDYKTSCPRRDSLFSVDACNFRKQSGELLDTAPITDHPSPQPDFPANCADSQLVEMNTNDVMAVSHSPVIGQPNFVAELAEESLDSNDVNTLPFSAVISKPSPALDTLIVSKSSGVPLEGKSSIVSGLGQETLEELNTNDVDTFPFSFVISKPPPKTASRKSKSVSQQNGSPTEGEFSELNTVDVMTLPCSFVIGEDTKKSLDTTTSPRNKSSEHGTKEDISIVKSKKVQVSERAPEASINSPLEDSSYMDRVWALFESDSDEEQEEDVTTISSANKVKVSMDKPCESLSIAANGCSDIKVTTSKECHVSQLEELNTADVLTVPYSPIVGEAILKTRPPEMRSECSNSDDTVCEEDSFVEEDSLTLEHFHGMRRPDSIFMGT